VVFKWRENNGMASGLRAEAKQSNLTGSIWQFNKTCPINCSSHDMQPVQPHARNSNYSLGIKTGRKPG
jgi:hypothetical protein